MDKKKFVELLKKFTDKYELENSVDDKIKLKILKEATAWNKETVMSDMIKRIDDHRLYEEEGFNYGHYVDMFLSGAPKAVNVIDEVDMS